MSDLPRDAEPAAPLGRATAALGLGALAALAWTPWVPLPVVAVVVVVAFLARRIAWLRDRAAWTAVYAAAVVFALGPWSATGAAERIGAYLAALALGLLVGAALEGVARGTLWAWLAPLVLFAVWPTAIGAAGGVGLAALGALSGREARGRAGGSGHRSTAALVGLGALAVAVGLVALPLGGAGGLRDPGGPVLPTSSFAPDEATGAYEEVPARRPARAASRRPQADGTRGLEATVAAVLAAAVVLALAFVVTLRAAPRAGRRPASWAELVPLGALALLAAVAALVLSQRAPPGATDLADGAAGAGIGGAARAATGAAPDEAPASAQPARDDAWTLVLTLAAVAAAGYVGLIAWRLRSSDLATGPSDALADPPDGAASVASANRVRAAYRAFLAVADRAGLGRQGAETPAELARRVGTALPDAARPAETLARLYEPVRYGGLSDERGALDAERALGELEGMLAPVSA